MPNGKTLLTNLRRQARNVVSGPQTLLRDSRLLRRWSSPPTPAPASAGQPGPTAREVATRERFERLFGVPACEAKAFVNFGAGNWRHPCFTNVDLDHPEYPRNRADVVYDAFDLQPLPLADGSVEVWYASHVNEHIPDRHNAFLLQEVYRVLKPGGLVRIVYPDLELAHAAYTRNDRDFFLVDWPRKRRAVETRADHPIGQLLLDFFASRAQVGSPRDGNTKYSGAEFERLIEAHGLEKAAALMTGGLREGPQRRRPNAHTNFWTFAKWQHVVKRAGFVRITRSAYLQSELPPLRDPHYFDRTCPHMSGYVEFRKP